MHQEQLDRLLKAMETCDLKEQAIAEKITQTLGGVANLTTQLRKIYAERAENAISASLQEPTAKDKRKGRAV